MEKLKECPFCGTTEHLEVISYNNRQWVCENNWAVECCACRCKLAYEESKENAIEAWNVRGSNP